MSGVRAMDPWLNKLTTGDFIYGKLFNYGNAGEVEV